MPTVIFDFDSTIISCESLEELQREQCRKQPELFKQLCDLTNQGMSGDLPFSEAIQRRLKLLSPSLSEVHTFAKEAHHFLSDGMFDLIQDLHREHVDVWIISGGLIEILLTVGAKLNIPADRIRGVSLLWNKDGSFLSLDDEDPFSYSKYHGAKTCASLWSTPSIMVGDGMTDYDVCAKGLANYFIAYTEHVSRQAVLNKGCFEANNVTALSLKIKEIIKNDSI